MIHSFHCSVCDQDKTHESDFTTGYGTDKDGNKVCFACCGINDRKTLLDLLPGKKMHLYYSNNHVTNWPNTLSLKPNHTRKSKTNWNLERTDFWFTLENQRFHGYQIGHNNQIAHIYKLKT